MSIKSILSITFVVLLIFTISSSVEGFKKLPLNGSMFGKRGTSIGNYQWTLTRRYIKVFCFFLEYESSFQKALQTMCEICDRQWSQDNYVNWDEILIALIEDRLS